VSKRAVVARSFLIVASLCHSACKHDARPTKAPISNAPPIEIGTLASGSYSTCAIEKAGTVVCWGEEHETTDDEKIARTVTRRIEGVLDAVEVAAPGAFGVARTRSGNVMWWFDGPARMIEDIAGATQIATPQLGHHGCAIVGNGEVRCFGEPYRGLLGVKGTKPKWGSVKVPELDGIVELALGLWHSCARTRNGEVSCWSVETDGPTRIVVSGSARNIVAGIEQTCAIVDSPSAQGRVECWTFDYHGKALVQRVPSLEDVVEIAVGDHHACARSEDGSVRCWGKNVGGETGGSTYGEVHTPLLIADLGGAIAIRASETTTCAILRDRSVKCWGALTSSAAVPAMTSHPRAIVGLEHVEALTLGVGFGCARVAAQIRCFGDDAYGQLGRRRIVFNSTPQRLPLVDIVDIAVGADHSCAKAKDGTVSCWGSSDCNQVGLGVSTPRAITKVTIFAGAKVLATPGLGTCVIGDTGTVRCVGFPPMSWPDLPPPPPGKPRPIFVDVNGPARVIVLDDGSVEWDPGLTAVKSIEPEKSVRAMTDVRKLVASGKSGIVLHTDRKVSVWSPPPSWKQDTPEPKPIKIDGLADVNDVDASPAGMCAASPAGVNCSLPTNPAHVVSGTSDSVQVSVASSRGRRCEDQARGWHHACAVSVKGEVSCWDQQFKAARVEGIGPARKVGVGNSHICALLIDGSVFCLGDDKNGALGVGSPPDPWRAEPIVSP